MGDDTTLEINLQLAIEKPHHQQPCLYPYLDAILVALNLKYYDEDDTLSLSSVDSAEYIEKSVRFGTIEIREYSIVKGDLLSCNDGLPLSLDWDYTTLDPIHMDEIGDDFLDGDTDCSVLSTETDHAVNLSCKSSRPKKLGYLERRLLLEQVGYKVKDCFGEIRSSMWLGVDAELPPSSDDEAEEH